MGVLERRRRERAAMTPEERAYHDWQCAMYRWGKDAQRACREDPRILALLPPRPVEPPKPAPRKPTPGGDCTILADIFPMPR